MPVNPAEAVLGGFLDRVMAAAKDRGPAVIAMKVLGCSDDKHGPTVDPKAFLSESTFLKEDKGGKDTKYTSIVVMMVAVIAMMSAAICTSAPEKDASLDGTYVVFLQGAGSNITEGQDVASILTISGLTPYGVLLAEQNTIVPVDFFLFPI
jgi:hypothetical protein